MTLTTRTVTPTTGTITCRAPCEACTSEAASHAFAVDMRGYLGGALHGVEKRGRVHDDDHRPVSHVGNCKVLDPDDHGLCDMGRSRPRGQCETGEGPGPGPGDTHAAAATRASVDPVNQHPIAR